MPCRPRAPRAPHCPIDVDGNACEPCPSQGLVRDVAPDCLRHRLMLSYEASADGVSANAVIEQLLQQVAVA